MFFRMGGPAATRAIAPRSLAPIHEPLCTGSAGVATDELWPALSPRQRVYLFRSGPWDPHEIATINSGHFQHLQTITPTPLEGQHP